MNTSCYCQTAIIQICRCRDNSCSNENMNINKEKRRDGNTSTIKLISAKKQKQQFNWNINCLTGHVKLSLFFLFERKGHCYISMANFNACLGLHLCKQIFEGKNIKQANKQTAPGNKVCIVNSDNQG